MFNSHIFSSFLCIGFLFPTFNAFVIFSQQNWFIPSNALTFVHDIARHKTQLRSGTMRRNNNHFASKGESQTPTADVGNTSSNTVKEMAAFLSIQLLQKVMAESMKPEGESNIDLEDVERLTKALQMSDSQPISSEPFPEVSSSIPESTEHEVTTTESNATIQQDLSMPSHDNESKLDYDTVSTADDNDGENAIKETEEDQIPTVEDKKEQADVPVAEVISSSQKVAEVIRSPLEIIQSNVPPLREQSVPRKTPVITKDYEQVEETCESNNNTIEEAGDVIDETNTSPTSSKEADLMPVLEALKAEESFRRRLLKQKLEYDMIQATRIEKDDDCDQVNDTKIDMESLLESSSETGNQAVDEDDKNHSIRSELSNADMKPPTTETKGEGEESDKFESDTRDLTSQRSSIIAERRIETIVALRQPKSTDEEIKLALKYAKMENLEDRAYAVLCDLGMVEEHLDPRDASYDHSGDDEYCEQRFLPSI